MNNSIAAWLIVLHDSINQVASPLFQEVQQISWRYERVESSQKCLIVFEILKEKNQKKNMTCIYSHKQNMAVEVTWRHRKSGEHSHIYISESILAFPILYIREVLAFPILYIREYTSVPYIIYQRVY